MQGLAVDAVDGDAAADVVVLVGVVPVEVRESWVGMWSDHIYYSVDYCL